ncbi:MAG: helix-turn-helix domain-containing protein [Gemmatimonadetes bacterium]|nr:helix-turn-helix domain-containing protein [Gemmatimonadota bacterium]MBK7716135.1 helix-turn-helix domain-containing protein [Gemmatimonadota bacterium]
MAFVDEALRENRTLAENGAGQAVKAREALLQRLVAAAQQYLDGQITVEEAAAILGRHPETIRRAVRTGALPDGRTKARGRHRIRRGDLEALAAPNSRTYDPNADAQDIARRRRPL